LIRRHEIAKGSAGLPIGQAMQNHTGLPANRICLFYGKLPLFVKAGISRPLKKSFERNFLVEVLQLSKNLLLVPLEDPGKQARPSRMNN
jgi:hypothetical protein